MATAAPGQLSAQQLMDARVKSGLAQGKNFYLFGTPIQHSLSPAMHNGAYGALLLPHKYSLSEQDSVDKYREVLADKSFGGASVTIPYKESIIPLIDDVRGAARKIGAVNTIVIEGGEKVGYNTDWLGIKRPVLRQLRKRGVPFSKTERGTKSIGLVIGAGGTAKAACYAVKDLGTRRQTHVTFKKKKKRKILSAIYTTFYKDVKLVHHFFAL
jgi:pentafunctional AROM polypeptide